MMGVCASDVAGGSEAGAGEAGGVGLAALVGVVDGLPGAAGLGF
jgi:hypothetical protein